MKSRESALPKVAHGGTPLTGLIVKTKNGRHVIELKREDLGPLGSIKGRVAVELVRDAIVRVPAVTHIVESTSGNLGHAMARVCRMVGLKFTAVIDPRTSPVLVEKIKREGGIPVVVRTPDSHGNYLGERVRVAQEIAAAEATCIWTNQYGNPANPRAHFASLAPEIFESRRSPAAIVVAVSTGGTARGIYDYIQAHSLSTSVVAVDVVGSRALGGPAGPRQVTGIGATKTSLFLGDDVLVSRYWVPESVAIDEMYQLERDAGLSLGVSTGAVLSAARTWIEHHTDIRGAQVVCVAADGGDSYQHLRASDLRWPKRSPIYSLQEVPGC